MEHFVSLLKSEPVGQIYWSNLCAHRHESCVDVGIVKTVFRSAHKEFQDQVSAFGRMPPEPGRVAVGLLYAEADDNVVAIGAVQGVEPVKWSEIEEITTVLNESTFWAHYAERRSTGHQAVLDEISHLHGPLGSMDNSKLEELLLQKCVDSSHMDLLKIFGDSLRNASFQSRVKRFWASFQSHSRATDPDVLIRQLGLTNFKVGQWVIEVAFNAASIRTQLAVSPTTDFRRPSALCVNDNTFPRFRALRPDEVGATAGGAKLLWHGTTLDINSWQEPPISPMDGLPELMCTSQPWGVMNKPEKITLLGQVKVAITEPNNNRYSDYLQSLYSLACANEIAFIAELKG
jgi:hypothetical protein